MLDAYRLLRRVENRVQMFADAQTHELPDDALARERIALALGFAGATELVAELDRHRAVVSDEFKAVMAASENQRGSEGNLVLGQPVAARRRRGRSTPGICRRRL